jgi:hypothetical protein
MIPGVWTKWNHELPPLDTDIEGKWDENLFGFPCEPHVSSGRRCLRGCCFVDHVSGGNLRVPQWWRVPVSQPEVSTK